MCLQDRKVDKTTRPGTNIESKPSCFYVEETCLVQDPIVHAIVIVTTDQPIVWNDLRAACCPITKHRCRHRSRRRPNLAQPRRVQSSTAPHPSPPRRGQQGGDDRRRMEKGRNGLKGIPSYQARNGFPFSRWPFWAAGLHPLGSGDLPEVVLDCDLTLSDGIPMGMGPLSQHMLETCPGSRVGWWDPQRHPVAQTACTA